MEPLLIGLFVAATVVMLALTVKAFYDDHQHAKKMTLLKHKYEIEKMLFYTSGDWKWSQHAHASSVAPSNYIQLCQWQDALQPKMTLERAIALNNGES